MDVVIDIRSTLHLINSQSIKLGECQLTHMHWPKISWLLTDCWCWSSVKWVSTEVSMECWWRVDRVHQLTVDSRCLLYTWSLFHSSSKKKVKPAFLSNLLWYTTVMSHCDWKLKSHDISKRVTRKHWPPVRRRVCKRGPWTGPWSSPWTGAVGGSMDWGSVFSGHPTEGLHLEKMKKSSKRNFSFSPFQCLTPKPMTCICS